MPYPFSEKMASLKPSAIREIFKYSADPEVVSLSAGNPAPEAFPTKAIEEITERILTDNPIAALQYSITEGYVPLREMVKADLKGRLLLGTENDELIITSGAQQGIDLTAKSFCDKGDVILCESPSFVGALNAFKANEAKLVGIPMEEDGIDVAQLEQALQQHQNAKLLYTIPNFQNPSGITMSWEKRQKVYELAKRYGVCIIEDNPYGDLRFHGEPIPAIKTLDQDGIVIYCGSFSKVLSPGLRVGYVLAPKEIVQKITVLKQTNDVHTNILAQMITCEYFSGCDLQAHLARLQSIYRHKSAIMLDEMDKTFNKTVSWTKPDGGLFVWCTLPEGVDMPSFCTRLVRDHKVAVVPGNAFLTDDTLPCSSFRINFSTPTDEQLIKGIDILGALTQQM